MQLVLDRPEEYTMSPVNQDDLWKKVIADLFEEFLLFFLPELHSEVDFTKEVEFLQQELFKEIIDERKGRKMADQIAKVYLKNGDSELIFVHAEVQSKDGADFSRRMLQYYYRIFDRYNENIVSIALITDNRQGHSNQFESLNFGTTLTYTYNKFNVFDFDEEELENSTKLFSRALLASIYMNKSKKNMSERSRYKRALLRDVIELENANRTEIRALLYFVDYLLKLPEEMSKSLTEEMRVEIRKERSIMHQFQKDDLPPTLAGILDLERQDGVEEGIKEGIKEGIALMVKGLIQKGVAIEVIADVANLTVEEVLEMKKNL